MSEMMKCILYKKEKMDGCGLFVACKQRIIVNNTPYCGHPDSQNAWKCPIEITKDKLTKGETMKCRDKTVTIERLREMGVTCSAPTEWLREGLFIGRARGANWQGSYDEVNFTVKALYDVLRSLAKPIEWIEWLTDHFIIEGVNDEPEYCCNSLKMAVIGDIIKLHTDAWDMLLATGLLNIFNCPFCGKKLEVK